MTTRLFLIVLGMTCAILDGCAVNPAAVSPSSSAVSHLCSVTPLPHMTDTSSNALVGAIQELEHKRDTVLSRLPTELRDDKVVGSILDLMISKKAESAMLFLQHLKGVGTPPTNVVKELARNRPASLNPHDFRKLYDSIISPTGAVSSSRVIAYESAYFNGQFYDRFGTNLPKPTLALTITDQEISAALTAFIEALADDLFDESPVWIDNNNNYYPGDTTNQPTFLAFPGAPSAVALVADGCGMTKLKADTLSYLSGKASTWAAGETGFVLGALGGANAGPVIVLGKLSIGDNKTLQTVAQTILAEAAKRATMEAVKDVLLEIDQPPNWGTVDDVLQNLVFGKSN